MKKAWNIVRRYLLPALLLIALAFSVFEGIRLSVKVSDLEWRLGMQETDDVGVFSVDSRINDLYGELASIRFIVYGLLDDGLLNTVNQYGINEFTTCKDIEMRLGSYYSGFNIIYSAGEENEAFKQYIDGLIEANKDRDASVRTWEHVEYCLLNQ